MLVMNILAYIDWNVDPVMFKFWVLDWLIEIRYYSLFFALAFWLGYVIVERMFKYENCPNNWVESLFIYTIIATIIGSRLGHVFFYSWDYYSQHPGEILKVWEGGLASHGGAIGILVALFLFHKRVSFKKSYLWILDHIVVPIALAAFFIRMGNLMNSEIVGSPTDVPWAFRFLRLPPEEAMIPRHPSQIYEALFYLLVFAVLVFLYQKKSFYKKEGGLFGVFLIGIFGFRIVVETMKENQEAFEDTLMLNMGQILSIPFVIIGIISLAYALRDKESNQNRRD